MFASVIGSASIKYAYLIHGSSYRSHTVLSFNLLVVWGTGPKLNQTDLIIYISHPKPPQPTNFQNQFNLDCNIISAKPPSNPRFQPHAIPTGMYLGPKYMHGKK